MNSSINKNNIEALKQRLLEPSHIILSYTNILNEKSVFQSLDEFEDELNKIINASQKLIDEINQAVSDDVINLESNEVLEYQKKTRHDLRNIINIILGYSEMILEDLDSSHQNHPDIKNLLEETKKFNSNLEELVQLNVSTKEQKTNSEESEILNKLASMIKPLAKQDKNNLITGKILIVDDNKSNCEMIERQLQREGHKTMTCFDGVEAMNELNKSDYDTVLLDVLMPRKNGYEVLMEMKQSFKLKDIPVIMISGFKEEDTIVRCIEAGVDEYLTKPINSTLLKAKIYSSLERKKFRDREKHDLQVAADVQKSLIPSEAYFPDNFYASNIAAKGVSGDFYDCIDIDSDRYAFILADVSGKGMHAGILMAKTSALFRSLTKIEKNIQKIAWRVNKELCETSSQGMFVTLVMGIYYKKIKAIEFVNAGHEPVMIAKDNGSFVDLESKSPPMGMMEIELNDFVLQTYNPKNENALFLTFTDGVTEGKTLSGDEFGRDGVKKTINQLKHDSIKSVIKSINQSLVFENQKLHDDITILGIEI